MLTTTKVRLVLCPKCQQLLPELAELPIYKCGGCGTLLQAKNRNRVQESISSTTKEKDPAQEKELEHEPKDKELNSSNEKVIQISAEQCSLDLTTEEQIESEDYNKKSNGVSSSGEVDFHDKGESSSENKLPSVERISTFTAQTDHATHSSLDEEVEKFQNIIHHDVDHVGLRGTVEVTDPFNPGYISEELSDTHRDISPTTRNSRAYYGSVSSYDDLDDQISDQFLHFSKRTTIEPRKIPEFSGTKRRPTRKNVLMSNKMNNDSMKYQGRKYSSIPLHAKHGMATTSSSKGIHKQEKENLQDCDCPHPVRDLSREPFYQMGSSKKDRSLNNKIENFEYYERMELLRKVDELRDELNKRLPTRGIQQEKQWPFLYNPEKLNDATFPPESDYSCLHCYPEYWHCLPKHPPAGMCCNTGSCKGHFGHMCYNHYKSNSYRLQPHMDMKYKVQKSYHKERDQPVKRHCLPIAGGAPFIICSSCEELLQLPADFLLSRKRFHYLQCSSCSEVLKFSLHNRTHIVPCSMEKREKSAMKESVSRSKNL